MSCLSSHIPRFATLSRTRFGKRKHEANLVAFPDQKSGAYESKNVAFRWRSRNRAAARYGQSFSYEEDPGTTLCYGILEVWAHEEVDYLQFIEGLVFSLRNTIWWRREIIKNEKNQLDIRTYCSGYLKPIRHSTPSYLGKTHSLILHGRTSLIDSSLTHLPHDIYSIP